MTGKYTMKTPTLVYKVELYGENDGVIIRVMRELPATLYQGDLFDISCVPINVPKDDHDTYCQFGVFALPLST